LPLQQKQRGKLKATKLGETKIFMKNIKLREIKEIEDQKWKAGRGWDCEFERDGDRAERKQKNIQLRVCVCVCE